MTFLLTSISSCTRAAQINAIAAKTIPTVILFRGLLMQEEEHGIKETALVSGYLQHQPDATGAQFVFRCNNLVFALNAVIKVKPRGKGHMLRVLVLFLLNGSGL